MTVRIGIYEAMLIIRPDLDDEKIKSRVEKIKHQLVAKGATIEKEELLGRRLLGTEFQHFRDGFYVLFYFSCDKELVREMEGILRISDDVIRYLIVASALPPSQEPAPAPADKPAAGK